jgi:ribosomal protein S18 acetylase RimI-like enzyme
VSEAFEVRLARPDEYDEIGLVTVRGYQHDGFVSESDDYATSLRDAGARAHDAELWVAVELAAGRVLGSVTYCPPGSSHRELADDTEGEFRMLAVDPSARGLGVGRALVRHCVDRSRDLGLQAVVICSLPSMAAAHALYLSLGFSRDPSLDWSPVRGVDLWAFRAPLIPAHQA